MQRNELISYVSVVKITKISKQCNEIYDPFRSLPSIPLGSILLCSILVHQSKHGLRCSNLFELKPAYNSETIKIAFLTIET